VVALEGVSEEREVEIEVVIEVVAEAEAEEEVAEVAEEVEMAKRKAGCPLPSSAVS
jgi:hypothetical protein